METTVYEVQLKDGRTFRVFCANKKQKRRFTKALVKSGKNCTFTVMTNGIHNIKEWESITDELKRDTKNITNFK